MRPLKLIVAMMLIALTTRAQDVVYATDLNAQKVKKITAAPTTGVTSGSFNDVQTIVPSAALGLDKNGWLYFLKYGDAATGEGQGKVDIYATKADGTGSPVKIANNADINGASNNDLGFVRLGVDYNNVAWIVASDASNNKIYLAKFNANGSSSVTVTTVTDNLNTSDGDNSLFKNGDLCFAGGGTMYVLANNDGSNTTKIYTIDPNVVTTGGPGTLQYKWTLKKQNGDNFTNRVNGVAFASLGSMYVTTDDGLYYIDQYTTNFNGSGTVQCKLVKSQEGLTDLATGYWPYNSRLPLHFTAFTVQKISDSTVEVKFTLADAFEAHVINITVSKDAKTFKTIAVVLPEDKKSEQSFKVRINLNTIKW